jgi:TrmH family RNA methyltransferase
VITSNQNQTYKHLLKLKKRKHRLAFLEAVIYGDDIIQAAKKQGMIKYIIGTTDEFDLILSEELIQSLADYPLTEKILAVIDMSIQKEVKDSPILILDNVQDPKNVGALIRSAEAFGFLEVVLGHGTADPYHEEAIRAAKGSTFAVKTHYESLKTYVQTLIDHDFHLILTTKDSTDLNVMKHTKYALVLGNEGQGIQEALFELPHQKLSIPTQGVESLNVSVAGGIAMYILRQSI